MVDTINAKQSEILDRDNFMGSSVLLLYLRNIYRGGWRLVPLDIAAI
jgi:hypothetical protein